MALLANRISGFSTTVFSEFSALAQKHAAVNLGQGFPDFDGPDEIAQAAQRAIADGANQYAVGSGAAVLRQALAEHSERFYGMKIDPNTMVTVTSGATEALFDAVMGLVDPGDEVVLFEPFYDSYAANVAMAGGQVRGVLLRPPDDAHLDWWFDPAELTAAVTAKTKLLLVNTPHNPTGKVFTRKELEQISELCLRHDVTVVADEVYEHLVFGPASHIRIATLPEMALRTLTIGSGGKSFGFTGWKVGWAIAQNLELRAAVQNTHQFVTFATASPLQNAIASALRLPDAYFSNLARDYQRRRDVLVAALNDAGLRPIVPAGTYFTMARIDHLGHADDFEFCRWLTTTVGVAAIPPSAFYTSKNREHGIGLARFAFCKRDETLALAAERLRAMPRKTSGLSDLRRGT